MGTVFIGVPTHSGSLDQGTARSAYNTGTQKRAVVSVGNCSLLNLNCNTLWFNCLNNQKKNSIEWFCLLHSDIEPEAWWVDLMIEEADRVKADVISAFSPIKDGRGVTSSGILHPDRSRLRALRRFTMNEIWDKGFPQTFSAKHFGVHPLILNTGCMVCRVGDKDGNRLPWVDPRKVYFESPTTIFQEEGKWVADQFPEDWWFTWKAAEAGAKVVATRKVSLMHKGMSEFPNNVPWGDYSEDSDCKNAA